MSEISNRIAIQGHIAVAVIGGKSVVAFLPHPGIHTFKGVTCTLGPFLHESSKSGVSACESAR